MERGRYEISELVMQIGIKKEKECYVILREGEGKREEETRGKR